MNHLLNPKTAPLLYQPPGRNGTAEEPRLWTPLRLLDWGPEADRKLLKRSASVLLAGQTPGGSYLPEELYATPEKTDDQLGGAAMMAAALRWEILPASCRASLERALRFHLDHLVWIDADSGLRHLRYVSPQPGPNDWCATLWTLLGAVQVLEQAEGLIDSALEAELRSLSLEYWRYLTQFPTRDENPCHNQLLEYAAIGVQAGRVLGAPEIVRDALDYYLHRIRPLRIRDRGRMIYGEFNQWCSHYFLLSWKAVETLYLETGNEVIGDDATEMAAAFDDRLSAGGYFYGGSRYDEGGVDELIFPIWRHALQYDFGRVLVLGSAERREQLVYDAHCGRALVGRLSHYGKGRPSSPSQARPGTHDLKAADVSVNLDSSGRVWQLSVAGADFLQARRDGAAAGEILWKKNGHWHTDPLLREPPAPGTGVPFVSLWKEDKGGWRSLRAMRRGTAWEMRHWWLARPGALLWIVHAVAHGAPPADEIVIPLGCPYLAADSSGLTRVLQEVSVGKETLSLNGLPASIEGAEGRVGNCFVSSTHPLRAARPSSGASAGFPLAKGTLWRDVRETNLIELLLASTSTIVPTRESLLGAVLFSADQAAPLTRQQTALGWDIQAETLDLTLSVRRSRGIWSYQAAGPAFALSPEHFRFTMPEAEIR